MKIKAIVMVSIITTSLVACAQVGRVSPRADNFAFKFESAPCGPNPVNVVDTTSGTLVYTPLGDTISTTIPFRVADDELESIYRKAIAIDFFDYPSEFIIPDEEVLGYRAPASSYKLNITNGELMNSIVWTDDTMTKPGYRKADQLRELMKLIDEIVQSHPEVQQLPGPKVGCA